MSEGTLTITLTGPVKEFVEAQSAAQGHTSPDDYVASVLHELQSHGDLHRLEAMLVEGLNSPAIMLDESEWASIRRDAQSQLENKNSA